MLIVIKVGGDLVKEGFQKNLLTDLVNLRDKHKFIIIHGGADMVTDVSNKMGHPPKFVVSPKGFKSRYTDREEIKIYMMVMAGLINKKLVASLESQGITAMGISGLDSHLVRATRKKQLIVVDENGHKKLIEGGFTGKLSKVNSEIIRLLLDNDILPVISPIAMGDEYEPLNVDGDRMAAGVAISMNADLLILLTDVQGIYIDGNHITHLNTHQAEEVMEKIGPGMITKLYASVEVVKGGVDASVITSGLIETPLVNAINRINCTTVMK